MNLLIERKVTHMSHGGIQFVGDWGRGERRLVESTVAAVDEYLSAHMPGPWSFKKGAEGFSLTQGSLVVGELSARKLGDLLEQLRRVTTNAAPWVTYSE
jgi:hypothetical protein